MYSKLGGGYPIGEEGVECARYQTTHPPFQLQMFSTFPQQGNVGRARLQNYQSNIVSRDPIKVLAYPTHPSRARLSNIFNDSVQYRNDLNHANCRALSDNQLRLLSLYALNRLNTIEHTCSCFVKYP